MKTFENGDIVRLTYGSEKTMKVIDADKYVDDIICEWWEHFEHGQDQRKTAIFSKSDLINLEGETK